MKPIKRGELDRWKQLAEGATEGPLQITTSSRGYFLRTEEQYIATLEYGPDREKTLNDALLFGIAREAVLELLAEVERLTGARVPELLRQIYEQREEILEAFIAKYGCEPDECEQVVQRSPDGEKYWVRLRVREGEG
jgi:hypothetical protein